MGLVDKLGYDLAEDLRESLRNICYYANLRETVAESVVGEIAEEVEIAESTSGDNEDGSGGENDDGSGEEKEKKIIN